MRYQWTHITQLHHQENDTEIPRFHTNKAGDSFLDSAGKIVGDYLQGGLSRKSMSSQHEALYWGNGNKNWICSGLLSEKTKKPSQLEALKVVIF